jgi:iron complex outermembrane receptor protein
LLTIIAAPAAAQAADPQRIDSSTILVVGEKEKTSLDVPNATGSRLNLTPLETPASITTIDGDTIRARGDQSIVEAQTRAPGITSVANLGNGGTALAARGFSGQGSVLQLIDGVRLFPAAGTITFPTDPWMVERIDVLSGPASVLYGQGALGGAVNVVMRKPNTARTEVEGEVGYGAQDSVRAAVGVGGPTGETFAYRVDGSWRRSDGYVDRGSSRSLALSGTLLWMPAPTLAVTLRGDHGDQRPMAYFGTPLINGRLDERNREVNYNVADARLRFLDNRGTLQIDWKASEWLTFSNIAYRLTSDRFWRNLESYAWSPPTGAGAGTISRSDNYGIRHDQTQWGDQGSVTLKTPIAGEIGNALVLGFDANLVKFTHENNFGSDPQGNSVDPFVFDPGLFLDTQGIAPRYRTRTNEYAIFAEDRITLGGGLSVVGGLRYEEDRVRRWAISYSDAGRADTFAFDRTFHNTTWRLGAVWQPLTTLSLYAQYATGVDPLGTLTTATTGQVAFSNARGDQLEAGVKAVFLDGRGTATLAGYRIVKKGLLAQRTLSSPVEQVGQRSAKGIEAAVTLDLSQGFGIDANGSVLDARFDDFLSGGTSFDGKTPPGIAETMANLWLRWDASRRLQARAGLRYVGRRFSDNANRFRIPGYATVDATLSYALTDHVAVDLRGYNLFDKAYAITSYGDEQWILGRPRSIDVALRAAF